MKKSEIKVGGLYLAKVGGVVTTVRVDAIRDHYTSGAGLSHRGGQVRYVYDVTNLRTGRRTTFRSAAKFRVVAVGAKFNEVVAAEPKSSASRRSRSSPQAAMSEEPPVPFEPAAAPAVVPASSPEPEGEAAYDREQAIQDDVFGTEGEQRSDPTEMPAESAVTTVATAPAPTSAPTSLGLAGRIAQTRSVPAQVPETVAGYTPTDEQKRILETVLSLKEGQVLVIEAGAGAGKTSTLRMLEEVLPGRGQYTAFNKSLVEDSRPKFRRAKCHTTHALAFGSCGRDYQHRLDGQRVRGWEVARMLGLEPLRIELDAKDKEGKPIYKVLDAGFLAGQVSNALKKFSQTADREIDEKHFDYVDGIDTTDPDTGRRKYDNNRKVREYLLPFAKKAWEDISRKDGTLPFQHDYYVKMWQLGEPVIGADYILLDEDQDTAPVLADVVRRQRQALLILVGDENQAIYEWRGATNAARLFPDAPVCYLTQSFRFGQRVADAANAVLGGLEEPTKLRMRGCGRPSRVLLDRSDDEGKHVGKVCYLYRTNAGAVGKILMEYSLGRRGCLVGKIDEVISFVEGALDLQKGRRTTNPELAVFESWNEVKKFVKEDPEGKELELMVRLVDDFGAEKILRALRTMPKEEYADFVCSTAHKSKGREWDTVVLGADFPPSCDMSDSDRRLLYVAATRAKYVLDLGVCTPFHPYTDREGNTTPGIKVTFTVEDPPQAAVLAAISGPAPQVAPPPAQAAPKPPEANVAAANGNPAAPASAAVAPSPSGEAIRQIVASAEGRVVTYTRLPSGEWGLWSSTAVEEGEVVEVRTRGGATKREKVGSIVLVNAAGKKWLATISR